MRSRKFIWIGAGLLAALAILAVVTALNWPFTEAQVRKALEDRFARPVRIASFHPTYFPPGSVARGVSFLHRKRTDLPPLITVETLTITGSYRGLLRFHKSVPEVRVIGLRVTIPPKRPGSQAPGLLPLTNTTSGKTLTIDELKTDGAVLEFRSGKPNRPPFMLEIAHLRLTHITDNQPLGFHAELINTLPPGNIVSDGQAGPWNEDDPGSTPVSGAYSYTNVKLAAFKGLDGTLAAQGRFSGTIGHIETEGDAEIPDFRMSGNPHTMALRSHFNAVVDGTDGDVELTKVETRFLKTTLLSKGTIEGGSEQHGKRVALEVQVARGRIEDFLNLISGDGRPSMSGLFNLHASVDVPPGPPDLLRKLRIKGSFGIGGGKFSDPDIQQRIEKLAEHDREDPQTAVSGLTGAIDVNAGVATLSRTSFTAPGSSANLDGTYNLTDKSLNLHGVLHTTGKLSDTVSGFRGLVLKAAAPFLKKKSVTVVPFKVSGTADQPKFDLDLGAKRNSG